MASTVIPHFTRGGELITTVNISLPRGTTQTVYTATEPCRVIFADVESYLYLKINGTATTSNNDFDYYSVFGIRKESKIESVLRREINFCSGVLSFNLEKGDYISMTFQPTYDVTYQSSLYVYTR